MIKITNLNKIYYKGKPNEIHVINNTTLELPNTGLISFLGSSGSGKTTLLNTIGGLDKANSGSIAYDDLNLSKYNMGKIDAYRSEHFGYVFQNYLLLEDISVYDNLKLALELIGITDRDEVKKRIEYCLKAVGLYKFRKKLAGQLSGGQMQRVSIARALVKQCKVIIADEPTGNLDSENTIEVMNILKKISKDALVLVVTHNREIAEFYSDRIIELKDGAIIKDAENVSSGSLESQSDRKIHLLDLNNEEEESKRVKLHLYTDESKDLHELTIVVKNNTIYIDSASRVQLVQGSSIELVNDHYKKLEVSMVDSFSYDTSWYNNQKNTNGFKEFFKQIGESFRYFYTDPKRKKLFNLIFTLIGIILAVLVLLQTNYSTIDTDSICNEPTAYKLVKSNSQAGYFYDSLVDGDTVIEGVEKGYILDMYSSTNGFTAQITYTSVRKTSLSVGGCHFPFTNVEKQGLILGRFPERANEVVLGKMTADALIKKMGSGADYSDIIGVTDSTANLTIVGVSKANTNSIYTWYQEYSSTSGMYSTYYFAYAPYTEYKVIEGRDIEATNEILVSEYSGYHIDQVFTYQSNEYKAVGIFEGSNTEFITKDTALLSTCPNGLSFEKKAASSEAMDSETKPQEYEFAFRTKDLVSYTLIEGEEPKEINEVIASVYSGFSIGDTIEASKYSAEGSDYKVVGLYLPKQLMYSIYCDGRIYNMDTRDALLMTQQATLRKMVQDNYYLYGYSYKIADTEEAQEFFNQHHLNAQSVYDYEYAQELYDYQLSKTIYPIIEAVLLAIILVYTYFSQRAKMISEIYDIGVYRSLGAKRRRIIRKNLSDNFAKATLTTLLGYVLACVVYLYVAGRINHLVGGSMLKVNWLYILLGVVILYASQILIGCLPIVMLLRKTPSEINSKYDI